MRAISIKQPFVEQILSGMKTREFRSRPTNIRERVFIYASLTPRREKSEWRKVGKTRDEVAYGVIVGEVKIVDCVRLGPRRYAYVLENPKRFKTPLVPMKHPKPQPSFWWPAFGTPAASI